MGEIRWNRGFGAGIAIAGAVVGLAVAFKLQDPTDPTDWSRVPWWLGPLLVTPLVLFGLTFVVNRTRWRLEGDDLVVSAWPIPIPRQRRYRAAGVASIEVGRAPGSERDDILVRLHGRAEPVVLFKGVGSREQGERFCAGVMSALAARGGRDR